MSDVRPIDPQTSALLVLDFQPAVLDHVPRTEQAVANTRNLIAGARAAGVYIAYVRVHLTAEEAAAVSPNNKMFGHFSTMTPPADGPESQVDPRLGALPSEAVFRKARIGAFSTTDLESRLRARGIDTLVVAGVATSGTVLSTVRDAADRDFRTVVVADCCADFDPEVHRVLVEKVFPMTSEVADTVTLLIARLGDDPGQRNGS